MSWHMRTWRRFVLVLVLAISPLLLTGAKRPGKAPKPGEFNPAHRTVELFQAMDEGLVDVKFIPRNSEQARLIIKNQAGEPLNVRLPEAFAGVPALAQVVGGGNGFGNGLGNGAGNFGGGNQGAGGGGSQNMGGGMGNGQNGGGVDGGMFNIAAEKVGKLKLACVCLEHGKANPRPAIPYRLVPLDSVSNDPALTAVLRGLAEDRYEQRAVQAAAWHLANNMSWKDLAAERIDHLVGPDPAYFTADELTDARRLVSEARREAAEQPATANPATRSGEKLSRN